MREKIAGFTLIELLFAAAILATALVVILGLLIICSYLNEDLRYFTIAVNDARLVMEEIKAASYYSLSETVSPPSGFASWGAWAVARLPRGGGLNNIDRPLHGLNQEQVIVTFPGGTAQDPLEVLVRVRFRGRRQMINPQAQPLEVSLSTRMTKENE